jgi:hypothetical protein
MPRREILDRIQKYVDPFRVTKGKRFRLNSIDPGDTCDLQLGKGAAADLLARGTQWLAEEQDMLYAQDRWSLLLVFQAMDAAGKDGTIKHVMSGVNPQGCQVFSFKQPSREDLDHDFMWRYVKCLPERGRIGIFNRSYYEEVLVVRVHPEVLERQRLPAAECWQENLGSPARRHRPFRGLPDSTGNDHPQVLFASVARGAEKAVHAATGTTAQALEILCRRHPGAGLLGRLHERLRGSNPRHRDAASTLVRRAGGQ